MPAPIGPRPVGIPTAPSTTPTTPAAPTAPAAPATGFSPSSRVDALKGKALDLALDAAAANHSTGTSFGSELAQGNVRLSEEVALAGTRTFERLVAGDRRRGEYAAAHPDAVWASSTASLGASVSFPVGVGAAFGFSGTLEASTLLAHDVSGARDAAAAVVEQLASLKLPHDTESLRAVGAAPGSEFLLRGSVGGSATVGASASASAGVVSAHATVGATASSSETFTKQLKVLEHDTVYFQLTQVEARSAGVTAGVTAGTHLNGALGNQVDRQLRLRVAGQVSAGSSDKVMGAVVLDLKTAQGSAALDYLMKASPRDAADYIQRNGLGATYAGSGTNGSASLEVRFGSANLLSTSTTRATSTGVLEEPGASSLLSTADYGRDVNGLLPRLFMGEERSVAVKAGELTRGGVTQRAVSVSLAVKDTELKGPELEQYRRFGEAMGAPFTGLPAATNGNLGKARFEVQVAITDGDLARLSQWRPEDVALAVASAQKDIEGGAMPAWFSQPQVFEDYRRQYSMPAPPRGDVASQRSRLEREYKQAFGRDLSDDIATQRAVNLVGKKLDDARGKPVEQWGGLLEAVGRQSSGDVRAFSLALNRMAGAQLVNLSLEGSGFRATATPQSSTPRALTDVVGEVLAPPA